MPTSDHGFGLVNELSPNGKFLHCEDWRIGRDASLELAGLSIGGFRCKSRRVRFTAPGGELTQAISVHGTGQRHIDHHIEVHHDLPHTNSALSSHAACDDQTTPLPPACSPLLREPTTATPVRCSRISCCSDKARAEAIPELEVLADEVAAAHGAASAGGPRPTPLPHEQGAWTKRRRLALVLIEVHARRVFKPQEPSTRGRDANPPDRASGMRTEEDERCVNRPILQRGG